MLRHPPAGGKLDGYFGSRWSRIDPAALRENVTSPGGTTAAGLAVLTEADFAGLIDRVVKAATERSRELGA